MILVSPSERSRPAGRLADPKIARPPLVALLARAPSPDFPAACTPGASAFRSTPLRVGIPSPTSCSVLVVSRHLDGFLRNKAAGLLHPATGLGVRRVSRATAHHRFVPRPEAPWNRHHLSRDDVRTLRRVSLVDSRTASLRPLPSCRCLADRFSPSGRPPLPVSAVSAFQSAQPTPGPCSADESVAAPTVSSRALLAPPMGLVPLRGLPGLRRRPREGEARCSDKPNRRLGRGVGGDSPVLGSADIPPAVSDSSAASRRKKHGIGASGVCPEAGSHPCRPERRCRSSRAGPSGCRPPWGS